MRETALAEIQQDMVKAELRIQSQVKQATGEAEAIRATSSAKPAQMERSLQTRANQTFEAWQLKQDTECPEGTRCLV